MNITVTEFFDPTTFSYSYVVANNSTAAIIDAVLDYDAASGRTSTDSADAIAAHIREQGLDVAWILETHIHADHLSAAQHLQRQFGGSTAVGANVVEVQKIFAGVFNTGEHFATDGRQFDRLLQDGERLPLGSASIEVMNTPGHTPACVTYVIGDNAFVGDTLFMPDYGTARTDFPGGDASTLYASIQRILSLPPQTKLYMCHDYGTDTRSEFLCRTTVAEQRASNIHVHDGVAEAEFTEFRVGRDRNLAAPRLLYPSVQFNMRGGAFPEPESNGQAYFKIPVRHT